MASFMVKEWEVTLPSKQELKKLGTNKHKGVYTIQWRWNTGNSCKPSEDVENPGSNCNERKCCSEVFTNCADVVFDGVPFDAPKAVKGPPKPQPIPSPTPGGGGGGAGGGCLREDDIKKNPWAKDDKLIVWCSNFKSAEECRENQQCRWDGSGGAGAGPEPEPEAEPESAHEMSSTQEAKDEGLKGVKHFCDLNKAFSVIRKIQQLLAMRFVNVVLQIQMQSPNQSLSQRRSLSQSRSLSRSRSLGRKGQSPRSLGDVLQVL